MAPATTTGDQELVNQICARAAEDLGMIIDRELAIGSIETTRAQAKVPAEGGVHLSFRIEFEESGAVRQGCLLVPLPDAISMACYLMVMPDEAVTTERQRDDLDRSLKDAMLEIANFLGGSADAVLRKLHGGDRIAARSGGCQGVAAEAVPNFLYEAGAELVVARIEATLADFPSFRMTLMLPASIVPND